MGIRSKFAAMTAAVVAVGASAFAPLSMANAAEVSTLPNGAQFSLSLVVDGTGHGTTSECFVNSANGFAVGDNTPNDGVVCNGDKVIYKLSYAFPSTTTATTYGINLISMNNGFENYPFSDASSLAFCVSDSQNRYTAKTSGNSCQITVAPNQSISGSFDIPMNVKSKYIGPSVITQPVSISQTGQPATMLTSEPLTVVNTPLIDDRLFYASSWTTTVVNGQTYIKYPVTLISEPLQKKGASMEYQSSGTLDLSAFPDGTLISDIVVYGSNTLVQNGNTASYSFPDVVNNASTKFSVLVPLPSASATWPLKISQNSYGAPDSPKYMVYYKDATIPEPPQNDVVNLSFNASVSASSLVGKEVTAVSSTGGHGTPLPTVRPNTPVWSTLYGLSFPVSVKNYSMCDAFNVVTTASGSQSYDNSRSIVVYQWDVSGAKSTMDSGYTVSYGSVPVSGIPSCSDSRAVWSSTPTATTNLVKVSFGDVSLASSSYYRFSVDVPFKSNDKSAYPTYPNQTTVNDTNTLSFTDSSGATTSGSRNAYFNVAGPTITEYASTNVRDSAFFSLPNILAANNAYGVDNNVTYQYNYGLPSDDKNATIKETYTISSCAMNVKYRNSVMPDYIKITQPNLGADGIACTADDVSGWVITADRPVTVTGDRYTSDIDFSFFVAPWAKTTDTIKTTVTGTLTSPVYGTSTATSSSTKNITTQSTVGQYKQVDYNRKMVGLDIGWTLNMFNTQTSDVSGVEYIDVLPYNGDANGSVLASPLTNVRLGLNGIPSGTDVYVTTDPPATISQDTRDPSNDPSNTSRWCLYGSAECPEGGNYTAIYTNSPSLNAGTVFAIHVTTATTGTANGNKAVNGMGTGYIASSGVPILPSVKLTTVLYLNTINFSVYRDTNFDNSRQSATEPVIPSYGVSLLDSNGNVIKTGNTDSSGKGSFTDLPDGEYYVQIDPLDPAKYSNVTQSWKTTGSTTSSVISLTDSTQSGVDFGLAPVPEVSITKTVDKSIATVGDVLTYTIKIKNDGYATITPAFDDSECSSLTPWSGDTGTAGVMVIGETWTRTCTHTVTSDDLAAGKYSNTATVTGIDGNPASDDPTVSAVATTTVTTPPSVQIVKTGSVAEGSIVPSGTTVTWTYTVKNTGGVTISSYTVSDDKIGNVCTLANLAAGDTATCTASGIVS